MDSSSLEPMLLASLENHLDGILLVRGDRKIIYYNKQFLAMCSIPLEVIYSGDDRLMYRHIKSQLVEPSLFIGKMNYLFSNLAPSHDYVDSLSGRRFSIRSFAFNELTGISRFWIVQDITELDQLAIYDRLTKCLNSNMWNKFLSDSTKSNAVSKSQEFCIAVIDLNKLKFINDRLGHDQGDKTIQKVADTLLSIAREGDKVYRTGGDEFAVIIHTEYDISENLAKRFNDEFVRRDLDVSSAVLWKSQSEQVIDVYRRADLKMLANKRKGTNTSSSSIVTVPPTHIYSDINNSSQEFQLASDLDVAIQNKEFSLVYQPIVDSSNQMIWCEVLMRWQRKRDGKQISPEIFIPIAEKNNKIYDLWLICWKTALSQLSDWRSNLYVTPKLAINLSPFQIDNGGDLEFSYVEQITSLCTTYKISPQDFYIELTETSLLKGVNRAARLFEELQSIGVKLCLDDFGTGFSSLSMLQSLPVDTLKIAGSFVQNLTNSHTNQAIIKATNLLASELGIKVVAECVESHEQFKCLNRLGCDYFQGYYFSKPLSAVGLEKILTKSGG